ncbi:MAG: anaerobic ribonucleoside-triphosphate reductase, partial [Varibaculum cambriense]|nr:anaerobic ribonucleoside-triphosphate reductase [Varibaculum cambriense]
MLRETSTSSATVVAKRDGRTVSFDAGKIYRAVVLAMNSQGIEDRDFAEEITQTVVANLDPSSLDVPTIQTAVEDVLMVSRYPEVARAYIEYRHDRDTAREQEMDVSRSLDKLMARDATVVNENANKDSTVFNTQRDLTSGAVAKAYALKNLLPEAVANAHLKGDIHFHDLDYNPFQPMTNCCLIDIEGMLREGFQIGNARVESPRSINTATAQIAQIIANVASSQYGGCSVDRTDEVLAPYARLNYAKHMKDAEEWVAEDRREEYAWTKTRKDIYYAMQ